MTDEEKRKFWQENIQAYRASKLNAVAWCKENNVKVHMLRKWITTFNKESKNSCTSKGWLPVKISNETEAIGRKSSSSGVSIHIGTATIEISSDFDPQVLEAVMGILSKRC